MFGTNVISKPEANVGTLAVQEIFPTLQGEGPYSGCPAIFVRLAGCNLACTFCDTQFDTGLKDIRPVATVAEQVKHQWDELSVRYPADLKGLVVITGGEPLRQGAVVPLISQLVWDGFTVQVETAGTVVPDALDALMIPRLGGAGKVVIVCSPKTPGVNPFFYRAAQHWKYVIRAGEVADNDGLPMRGTQPHTFGQVQRLARYPAGATVWVSPCDDHDPVQNAANVAEATNSAIRYGYRLSLQVHKLVNLP